MEQPYGNVSLRLPCTYLHETKPKFHKLLRALRYYSCCLVTPGFMMNGGEEDMAKLMVAARGRMDYIFD